MKITIFFFRECGGKKLHEKIKKTGVIQCLECKREWTMCSSKITETIQRRTEKFIMAHKCLLQPTLSELNTKFMLDFKKTSEKWLNNHGKTFTIL